MDIEDLKCNVAAILWYLYRKAECPFGSTYQGFQIWIKTAIAAPFEEMSINEWKTNEDQEA